jgi:hypothetical protein
VVNGHTYPVGTGGLTQLPVGQEDRDVLVSWLAPRSSGRAVSDRAAVPSGDEGIASGDGPGGRCQVRLPALRDADARAGAPTGAPEELAEPLELDCKVVQ